MHQKGSSNPFFSIIIATFNARNQLEQCINSINDQEFKDYEILISDGGANDGTFEYLASGRINRLAWYKSSQDNGIYEALNIALEHASGQWVLVLGSDDKLSSSKALAVAYEQLIKIDSEIAYGDLLIQSAYGVRLKNYPTYTKFKRKYRGGAFIHHQSAFVKYSSIINANKFSANYRIHADYDLMLKILQKKDAVKIEGAYVVFNANGYSSKLSNLLLSFKEIFVIRKNHNLFPMPEKLLISYSIILLRQLYCLIQRGIDLLKYKIFDI